MSPNLRDNLLRLRSGGRVWRCSDGSLRSVRPDVGVWRMHPLDDERPPALTHPRPITLQYGCSRAPCGIEEEDRPIWTTTTAPSY